MDEARAGRPLAAFHAIAGDADVVGRRAPAEIDLRGTDGCGRHAGHSARWSGVGGSRWCDGRGSIRLDLRQGQHAAVDPDFIEQAAERITAVQVAERHDMAHAVRFQGLRRRGDQRAIHIDPQRIGAVRERHGEMVPVRVGNRAGKGVAGAERPESQPVIGIEVELFAPALPEGAVALAEEMALAAGQNVPFGPEFNREIGGADVVGARIGHGDGIVDAIEGEGLAIGGLPGHPEGAVDQRANMSGP